MEPPLQRKSPARRFCLSSWRNLGRLNCVFITSGTRNAFRSPLRVRVADLHPLYVGLTFTPDDRDMEQASTVFDMSLIFERGKGFGLSCFWS